MKILKNKDGNSTLIYSIVITFFLCAVTVLVLGGIEFRSITLNVTHTAKTVLDEYISSETKIQMDSIKNGTDYIIKIDEDGYKNLLENAVESESFEITDICISSDSDLDITLKFTLLMPFEILDTQIITFDREIEITSKYTSKFWR